MQWKDILRYQFHYYHRSQHIASLLTSAATSGGHNLSNFLAIRPKSYDVEVKSSGQSDHQIGIH